MAWEHFTDWLPPHQPIGRLQRNELLAAALERLQILQRVTDTSASALTAWSAKVPAEFGSHAPCDRLSYYPGSPTSYAEINVKFGTFAHTGHSFSYINPVAGSQVQYLQGNPATFVQDSTTVPRWADFTGPYYSPLVQAAVEFGLPNDRFEINSLFTGAQGGTVWTDRLPTINRWNILRRATQLIRWPFVYPTTGPARMRKWARLGSGGTWTETVTEFNATESGPFNEAILLPNRVGTTAYSDFTLESHKVELRFFLQDVPHLALRNYQSWLFCVYDQPIGTTAPGADVLRVKVNDDAPLEFAAATPALGVQPVRCYDLGSRSDVGEIVVTLWLGSYDGDNVAGYQPAPGQSRSRRVAGVWLALQPDFTHPYEDLVL